MAKENNKKMGAGLGLAALLAAAAGAYYFYGSKKAPKHRRQLKSWAVKAQGEVMERLENLKEVSQDTYAGVVDQVVGKYQKYKHIPADELAAMAAELKGHWNRISKELDKPGKKSAKPRRRKSATAR
ncbi:MAG: hypothetical protein M1383_05380 [Patescibacteria group bacterium]|nr:hypothetical protein [Patescibacteria group bacterium]